MTCKLNIWWAASRESHAISIAEMSLFSGLWRHFHRRAAR
jgi:hypothetical protein